MWPADHEEVQRVCRENEMNCIMTSPEHKNQYGTGL